ncbi:MAG TPA: arsinothricin resistance N-acetyltransferase ArsN1 family B [Thermoanaerobaculia bacterium]|jgi:phosphinothricin acetyltransferase|nr:arsinothricin resistance N-acetyltransferase ArsN1 family B [Thermoanaerobaculia bacterium]
MSSTIRLAQERDAEAIQRIYAPFVLHTAVSFETEPPSVDEMRSRILKILARLPWLVCEWNGGVIGYAYASLHRERAAYGWSVDVTVYIHEELRRHGVGKALYTSLFQVLRLQGFYNAYAGVTLPNPGSVGLHEAMGFEPVGVYHAVGYKHGRWHDVGWWQLALRDHSTAPAALADIASVAAGAEWDAAIGSGLAALRV